MPTPYPGSPPSPSAGVAGAVRVATTHLSFVPGYNLVQLLSLIHI